MSASTRTSPARALLVLVATLALSFLASPAVAVPGPPKPPPTTKPGTELRMVGVGAGQGVSGGIRPQGGDFDPLAGYPADVPTGFEPLDENFAGIILGQWTTGGVVETYCVQIQGLTSPGIGYRRGTWDSAALANLGYVRRIVDDGYPSNNEPAGAPNNGVRAAAVQAAIWFFTDGYVLAADEPVRPYVEAIVADAIAAGPSSEPAPPEVQILPTTRTGPADRLVGPYQVEVDAPYATISVDGGTAYTDASGTQPVTDGAPVPTGIQLWLRAASADGGRATLTAEAVVPISAGTVYRDNSVSTGPDAQALVLARDADGSATLSATADFVALTSVVVTTDLTGSRVADHGPVRVRVSCDDGRTFDVERAAGASGAADQRVDGLAVGSVCQIAVPEDGATTGVVADVDIDPASVQVAADDTTAVVRIAYATRTSTLQIGTTIAGPEAGNQGAVRVHLGCAGGGPDVDVLTLPEGQPAGRTEIVVDDLPIGAVCTVTVPEDGSSDSIDATTTIVGSPITVTADQGEVEVTNTYTEASSPDDPGDGSGTGSGEASGGGLADTGAPAGTAGVGAIGGLLVLAGTSLLLRGWRRR